MAKRGISQDNTTADALSRYPHTPEYNIAQISSQHPHIAFDKNKVVILDQNSHSKNPLSTIAALTDVNTHKTKIEFKIDDDTITKLKEGYETRDGTLLPNQPE